VVALAIRIVEVDDTGVLRIPLKDEILFRTNEFAKDIMVVVNVIDDDPIGLYGTANHWQEIKLKHCSIGEDGGIAKPSAIALPEDALGPLGNWTHL
jgi:hypothetical protein